MRLSVKFLVPQFVLLALMTVAAAVLLFDLSRQQRSLRTTREQFQAAAQFAEQLDRLHVAIASDVLSYPIDGRSRRLETIAHADAAGNQLIAAYGRTIQDPKELQLLKDVIEARSQTSSSRRAFLRTVSDSDEQHIPAAFDRWRIHRVLLDASLQDLAVFTANRFSETAALLEQERLGAIRSSLYGLAIAVVVTVGAFYYMRRAMTRPLAQLALDIEEFGRGRLEARVSPSIAERPDEIGALAGTFNRMAAQLEDLNRGLERRVDERTAQLEAANKELEAFSYSVSHDLRAPLRAIDGFSHAVMDDYADKLDDTGREYLARVRKASQRMAQLIDDMLRLSRVTRSEMKPERVNLSALAEAAVTDLRRSSTHRDVVVDIAPNLSANCDQHLVGVAIENLMANAWKFTSKRSSAHIAFGGERRDGEMVCFVRDDGVGFDMQYVQKLFTPFQRLHTLEEFPGTGIGLATVKRIVARHGGRVWAEGAPGGGATFYFTLPEG